MASASPLKFNAKPYHIALNIARAMDAVKPGVGSWYLEGYAKRRHAEIDAAFPSRKITSDEAEQMTRKKRKENGE